MNFASRFALDFPLEVLVGVDFYAYDTIGGRSVFVRFSMWKITDDTAQSEQAFPVDGGKNWEVNWINYYTRVKGE